MSAIGLLYKANQKVSYLPSNAFRMPAHSRVVQQLFGEGIMAELQDKANNPFPLESAINFLYLCPNEEKIAAYI